MSTAGSKFLPGYTDLEKSWVVYDVGNSAFTLMVSTLIPIWFNTLAERAGMSSVDYLANWSFATSIATIVMALWAAAHSSDWSASFPSRLPRPG